MSSRKFPPLSLRSKWLRLFSLFLSAWISVQAFPAVGQIINQQTLEAANRNAQQQEVEGTIPGIYYDPSGELAPTFNSGPGADTPGSVLMPPGYDLPYNLNRAWKVGATPAETIKIGDLQGTPQFDQFRQKSINEILTNTGKDPATVTLSEVPIASSMTLDEYLQINPGAAEVSVDEAPPVVQAAVGYYEDESLILEPIDTTDAVFIEQQAGRPEISDIPAEDLLEGDWGDVFTPEEQSKLEKTLNKVNDKLKKLPLKQIFPIVNGAIAGDWDTVKKQAKQILIQEGSKILVKELLKNPKIAKAIKDLPLGALQTDKLSLADAPGLGETALKDIPGADDKTVNQIPGLDDIPLDEIDLALALSFTRFDLLGRFDIADAAAVVDDIDYVISGGTKDQIPRPTPCKIDGKDTKNCRHFELDNLDGGGKPTELSGKAWVQGSDQKVEGGKGFLAKVNGGKEPTGIKPWVAGPVKLLLEDIKEGTGGEVSSARLSTAWQLCVKVPILGLQCTPHVVVVPTPYRIKEGGIMLLLSRSGSIPDKIAALRPTGQLNQLACQTQNNIVATQGQLPGVPVEVSDPDPDQGTVDYSKKRSPEHFRKQYLKRIALGESTSGTDLGDKQSAIATNGVWGIYQFRYSTAQEVKRRTGFDAYSDDPNEQANAAWAHIGIYGQQIGVDLQGAIERADFTKADQALGVDQWTSLPGGSEESSKWGQSTFGTYGPFGDAPDIGSGEVVAGAGDPCATASGVYGSIGPEGDGIATGKLANPLPGAPITSGFGSRVPPKAGASSFHAAVDLGMPTGTPILAADGGVVEYSGSNGGYGNFIMINHGNGLATWYAHNQANHVRVGQKVSAGQQIGTVGSTGISTGPHLDFGVVEGYKAGNIYSGQAVNPSKHVRF